MRGTFADLINRTAGMTSCGEYGSCEEALAAFSQKPPHVVLMDIGLPGMSGIEGARTIKERFPFVDILMLTVYEDSELIFKALAAGASGYLLKRSPPPQLLEAIADVVAGASMRASASHDLGRLVLMPGLIDTHVHVNEPGRTDWEGFETAGRAAATGGITTLVVMRLNSCPTPIHTFRRGHRIMVQVQSTWFPRVDINPQTFTRIAVADPSEFRPATQRVYHGPAGSSLSLGLVPAGGPDRAR